MQLEGLIPLIISKEILEKLKFLCSKIAKVEWSGLLFYTVKGSIRNCKRMSIVARDILLMDKGTSGYTQFDWDEDVVAYRMENPDAMDWHVGHIHSHNTMKVFFSGTDWEELDDNCVNHNYYLSLIVNNFMEMEAKIAFTAELQPKQQTFECLDEDGKPYLLSFNNTEKEVQMFVFDCDVIKPIERFSVNDRFINRIAAIENRAIEKAKVIALENKKIATLKQLSNSTGKAENWYGYSNNNPIQTKPIISNDVVVNWEGFPVVSKDPPTSLEELFLCFIMRLGEQVVQDTLLDTLEDLELAQTNIKSLVLTVTQNFSAYYDTYFSKLPKYHVVEEEIKVLQHITFMLDQHSEQFDIARDLSEILKKYKIELETPFTY